MTSACHTVEIQSWSSDAGLHNLDSLYHLIPLDPNENYNQWPGATLTSHPAYFPLQPSGGRPAFLSEKELSNEEEDNPTQLPNTALFCRTGQLSDLPNPQFHEMNGPHSHLGKKAAAPLFMFLMAGLHCSQHKPET